MKDFNSQHVKNAYEAIRAIRNRHAINEPFVAALKEKLKELSEL